MMTPCLTFFDLGVLRGLPGASVVQKFDPRFPRGDNAHDEGTKGLQALSSENIGQYN